MRKVLLVLYLCWFVLVTDKLRTGRHGLARAGGGPWSRLAVAPARRAPGTIGPPPREYVYVRDRLPPRNTPHRRRPAQKSYGAGHAAAAVPRAPVVLITRGEHGHRLLLLCPGRLAVRLHRALVFSE
jgi:hypothetical protein